MTIEPQVLRWDIRTPPDLTALSALIKRCGGTIHLHEVDPGSDDHAIVVSARKLTADEAQEVFDAWFAGFRGEE